MTNPSHDASKLAALIAAYTAADPRTRAVFEDWLNAGNRNVAVEGAKP